MTIYTKLFTPPSRRSEDFTILPYSDPDEFITDYLEHSLRVGIIVLNIGAACVCEHDIYNATLQLKRELPNIPVILLADRNGLCNVVTAFRNGVRGYILSSSDPLAVIQSLRLVMLGGTTIPHSALVEISDKTVELLKKECPKDTSFDPTIYSSFTPRQLEVLQLLRKGESNKLIAYKLGMQECTVKTHLREIMTKLNAVNRTHAVFLLSEMMKEKVS